MILVKIRVKILFLVFLKVYLNYFNKKLNCLKIVIKHMKSNVFRQRKSDTRIFIKYSDLFRR